MQLIEVALFLLLCAVALGWLARHFRFPYPIALVIGGTVPSFMPGLPKLQFDPQFILVLQGLTLAPLIRWLHARSATTCCIIWEKTWTIKNRVYNRKSCIEKG